MTGKPVSYHSDRCWVAASNAASIEIEKKAVLAIILQTTKEIQPESFCFIICCHQILLATRQALKLFTHGWRLGCSQSCQAKHLSWATKTSSHSLLPASKLFLLWMASRRSGPLHIVWVFLSSSEAVESSCSQEECAYSWVAAYSKHWWCGVWCGAVAQAERERLLHQSNCSLLPLLLILTQPACIKTPAVHCAGESPRFSLDSLCGTSWFQSTHMLVGQSIESNALQKISTDKALLCRVGKDLGYIWQKQSTSQSVKKIYQMFKTDGGEGVKGVLNNV